MNRIDAVPVFAASMRQGGASASVFPITVLFRPTNFVPAAKRGCDGAVPSVFPTGAKHRHLSIHDFAMMSRDRSPAKYGSFSTPHMRDSMISGASRGEKANNGEKAYQSEPTIGDLPSLQKSHSRGAVRATSGGVPMSIMPGPQNSHLMKTIEITTTKAPLSSSDAAGQARTALITIIGRLDPHYFRRHEARIGLITVQPVPCRRRCRSRHMAKATHAVAAGAAEITTGLGHFSIATLARISKTCRGRADHVSPVPQKV